MLSVDGVVAGYTNPVVGPVSFAIGRGEIVALSGANGSGKTTLLNVAIGRARVFGGRVACDRAAGVAVLRQFPVRLAEMPITSAEFVRLNGAATDAVPAILRPFLSERVDRLSGGQYQLLQVWTCLGSRAGLVMLDEPTNNMDPHAVASIGELLIEARERGKGVLVISHEAAFLARVCTRIVELGS